jgi:SH3 domain protein
MDYAEENAMLPYRRITMVIVVSLLCNVTAAWAETRYISDQLVVSLREQPQNGSETIVYLKTDTPVEVLEVGEQYIHVKTTNGEVGYIQKSYLTEETPKATVISRLTRENEGLKERIRELEKQYREAFSKGDEAQKKILSELEDARLQIAKLDKALLKSETELAERTQAYEALKKNAENIIEITAERDQLRLSHAELTTAVTSLDEERKELLKKETIQWFLTGAGVLFLGWVIGKFSRSRRKSSLY